MIPYHSVDTFSPQIPESSTKEIFDSVVRIETYLGKATGFFLKIKIRDRELNALVTNCHVIPKAFVECKKKIYIYYGKKGNEIKKIIYLDVNERFIRCFESPKDITIVEIKNYDYIPDYKFLLPDLNYKTGFNTYINQKFYLAGYPSVNNWHVGERHISSGYITKIYGNDFEFEHSIDKNFGSSGSPICLLSNNKVVGVHKANRLEPNYRIYSIGIATFIKVILDELEKDYYLLPTINNDDNTGFDSNLFNDFGLIQSKSSNNFGLDSFFGKSSYLMDQKPPKIETQKLFNFEDTFNQIDTYIDKQMTNISNMMNMTFNPFMKTENLNIGTDSYTSSLKSYSNKINFGRSKTPLNNSRSFYEKKTSFKEKKKTFYNKKNNDNSRNKTPINSKDPSHDLNSTLTEILNYNISSKNNNNFKSYELNYSKIRQTNKSYEPKLKKNKNKTNKNKNKTNSNKMHNISCYTNKTNNKKNDFLTTSKYKKTEKYSFIQQTKKASYNFSSHTSKSFDCVKYNYNRNNYSKININTINNTYESFTNNYNNSHLNYNMFSSSYSNFSFL